MNKSFMDKQLFKNINNDYFFSIILKYITSCSIGNDLNMLYKISGDAPLLISVRETSVLLP